MNKRHLLNAADLIGTIVLAAVVLGAAGTVLWALGYLVWLAIRAVV